MGLGAVSILLVEFVGSNLVVSFRYLSICPVADFDKILVLAWIELGRLFEFTEGCFIVASRLQSHAFIEVLDGRVEARLEFFAFFGIRFHFLLSRFQLRLVPRRYRLRRRRSSSSCSCSRLLLRYLLLDFF